MIERYSRPEMAAIWSDQAKFDAWLRVEIAVCEAWAARGAIPAEALPEIRRARFRSGADAGDRGGDRPRCDRLSARGGREIGAESRYIHLGLTSTDVVDTAQALQIGDAGALLLRRAGLRWSGRSPSRHWPTGGR